MISAGSWQPCIQNDKFLKITQTVSKTISSIDGTFRATLNNHNALLSMVEGVISGKTGFTAKAGYCYVGAYRKEDRTYTFALLACGWPNNKGYKWEDARKLIAYGNEHYVRQLYSADGEKRQIPIRNGVKIEEEDTGRKKYKYTYPEHFVVETETVRQELLLSDIDVITETWNLPKTVEAPVKCWKCDRRTSYFTEWLSDCDTASVCSGNGGEIYLSLVSETYFLSVVSWENIRYTIHGIARAFDLNHSQTGKSYLL